MCWYWFLVQLLIKNCIAPVALLFRHTVWGFVLCVSFGNICTFIYYFCIYCTDFIVSFMYVFLLVFAVLPPSDNSIAVNNNNNNNNYRKMSTNHESPFYDFWFINLPPFNLHTSLNIFFREIMQFNPKEEKLYRHRQGYLGVSNINRN
jgi:hypothetical protein